MTDLDSEAFTPQFFPYHINGEKRAMFAHEYEALAFQRGNAGDRDADVFYMTDLDGKRVTFRENRYGHAHAILDILDV